jgi:RimJ/RimL family protein N-acetyltransferase
VPLTPPDPPLADDTITLEPLAQRHVPVFQTLVLEDDIRRFTMVPTRPDRHFAANWVARYERGWAEGSRAGFAILGADGAIVGFAGIFGLDDPGAEGEIGYLVAAEARGQGIAGRSVALLTRWGFDELGLERIELRIDTDNVASARVAERAGYRLDGVLRSKHFKEGLRTDLGIWSRLRSDVPTL